jgi:hypothetical protein
MPRKPASNRPDFRLEIDDGKLILQTRFKTLLKLGAMICTFAAIVILIVLALLYPEAWLDILRAILLLLEPALALAAGLNRLRR